MICPLHSRDFMNAKGVIHKDFVECREGECAWWDKIMGKCAILCLIEVNLEMNKRIGQTIRLLTSQKGI